MVDASMGGKTGFDLPEGKNLVGAFYPPRLVLADPDVLSTLPERELRAGLAEVVKHGVIADPELFELCAQGWKTVTTRLPEVVRRGMAVKVKVIEEDPYERGIRAGLNLGHTIGHAVELVSGFSLLHGEAVGIGMVAEARLAERLTITSQGLSDAIAESLIGLDLPVEIPEELDRAELIRAMRVDKKKAQGVVRFALPVSIGEVKVGVEIKDLEEAL
jgi:3-dehydroquinate synthetase